MKCMPCASEDICNEEAATVEIVCNTSFNENASSSRRLFEPSLHDTGAKEHAVRARRSGGPIENSIFETTPTIITQVSEQQEQNDYLIFHNLRNLS